MLTIFINLCPFFEVILYIYLSFGGKCCLLSGDRKLSSWRLKNALFLWQSQLGHVVCPLYRGDPYLGESVMGGSTVQESSISVVDCTVLSFVVKWLTWQVK